MSRMNSLPLRIGVLAAAITLVVSNPATAQLVCFPAPRLLTTMPMGAATGTTVEVKIAGDYLEDVEQLLFSDSRIAATPQKNPAGDVVPNTFLVTVAEDCPTGIHEARALTRLGVSSARAFSVSNLAEVVRTQPNTSLESALELPVGSVCNATLSPQSVDHYRFAATAGQRIVVDCSTFEIDSMVRPVLIVGDSTGADLYVNRKGGRIDFVSQEAATYVVKVHDLIFNGGPNYFYRLAIQTAAPDATLGLPPSIRLVNSFSWPPAGLTDESLIQELASDGQTNQVQRITLPCQVAGKFYPAADVDTYEFEAIKGDVWWIEVASERLGRPTDPSLVVQHVAIVDGVETVADVAEFTDIPNPVKVSSNGYSYDGPPYHAGSADIIGKLEITTDGLHRLKIRDLLGATRTDPRNEYRLVIRKAAPDFALAGWALHMGLRNGDRAAFSKPLALRGGTTMAIEVVAVRRDGFDGPIELKMENLPEGVTATGMTIPAGQTRGHLLVTADQNAPRGFTFAQMIGTATIDGQIVNRQCQLASMQWPVRDASQQIPSPRLVGNIAVSVSGSEFAPLTLAGANDGHFEAVEGSKLTLPLIQTRRSEFSGLTVSLDAWSTGMGNIPGFNISLADDTSEVTLDLATMKTAPGEYVVAFYGGAVAKFRHNPQAVTAAEDALKSAQTRLAETTAEAATLRQAAETAASDARAAADATAAEADTRQKAAESAVKAAEEKLKAATTAAQPTDIVDIVVSSPIRIRVTPASKE